MAPLDTFTEPQRRHLVHIYAALRECIADEIEYDRAPEYPALDDDTQVAIWSLIAQQLTTHMVEAHAEEAARLEAESAAYWAGVAERWPDD